ncbi:MAG: NAD(P)-binding domain-containing protein [Bacteroidales bacterium]|nr:NAD(P)-binding domain-containing protein [Bacteroidales bacterium]
MATKLLAVTGKPILHSKSPNMFNAQFKHYGIDAEYLYFAAETAEEAIFLFRQLGLKGMNVTSPFKEQIGKLLDVVHDEAKILDSVNTVVSKDGKLHGYNTDFYGVTQSFADTGISIQGKKCLVIGAGGAGKSAAYGLHSQGAEVTIINRTLEKAQKAAEIIGCNYAEISQLEQYVRQSEIIISALQQNINPIEDQWLTKEHIIFDANYKGSPLIEMAKQKQCTIVSAEDWLLNQAIASYKLFLDAEPDKAVMKSGLQQPTLADKNHVISTIGIMGAGKSSHGLELSKQMQFDFKDIDDEIVKEQGKPITQIFAEHGEAYFRNIEKETLSKNFSTDKPCILSCGGGIVLNEPNRNLLKDNTLVIWLYATPDAIIQRVNIAKRPLLQCDNPLEKLQQLLNDRKELYARTAHVVFSTETRPKTRSAERLKDEIERIWKTK